MTNSQISQILTILNHTIAKLRKAFGDNPRAPRVIETVPKVGYRLMAPLEWSDPVAAEAPQRRSKLAVILHADIVGSTVLVRKDEGLAHDRIREAFGRLSVAIEAHHGIVNEVRGDALVAEFPRASDAVLAALAFGFFFADDGAPNAGYVSQFNNGGFAGGNDDIAFLLYVQIRVTF